MAPTRTELVGHAAPDFPVLLLGIDGAAAESTLHAVRGEGRPMVVEFFAPWCSSCPAAARKLEAFARGRGDGCCFLLVCVDGDLECAREFAAACDIARCAVVAVRDQDLPESYSITGFPHYTIVSSKGTVLWNCKAELPLDLNSLLSDSDANGPAGPVEATAFAAAPSAGGEAASAATMPAAAAEPAEASTPLLQGADRVEPASVPPVGEEVTKWVYKPANGRPMGIRMSPDVDGPLSDLNLNPKEEFLVSEQRAGSDGILYLKLQDGRGWAIETKPGCGTLCVRAFVAPAEGAAWPPLKERFALATRGPTLIFDGVCNLCNQSMRWYYDRLGETGVFFMWAQHEDTQVLLDSFGIHREDILTSWAYVEDGIVFRGSTAWFRALKHLRAPWKWLSNLDMMPETLREGAYGVVARNRYSALGKTEACQRPERGMKKRFLHPPVSKPAVEAPLPPVAPGSKRRLLVVGCSFAGVQVVRALAAEFAVTVVEPKDYFEYTPGILRGLADEGHLPRIQMKLAEALERMDVQHIRGVVTRLGEFEAGVEVADEGTPPCTIAFDYAVVAAGSQYAGGGLWKVTGAPGEAPTCTLEGRRRQLAETRQQLVELREQQGCVVLVGAGLVGVEMAAELVHFFPGLRVVLADLAETVLPALPKKAREYAGRWLRRGGVELRLGVQLPREGVAEALGIEGPSLVLGCAGVKMSYGFLAPLDCCDGRGAVRVNRHLQVLANRPGEAEVAALGLERAQVCAAGRIFALGDCVAVEGADPPFGKDCYPAEAMAELVVANLRSAKTVQCLRTCPGILRELKTSLNSFTLCSLGPNDAVFVANGYTVATGFVAATMKQQIEDTKMGQLRQRFWGSLVWSLVPHW